jgi:hypothetical protein
LHLAGMHRLAWIGLAGVHHHLLLLGELTHGGLGRECPVVPEAVESRYRGHKPLLLLLLLHSWKRRVSKHHWHWLEDLCGDERRDGRR